MKKTRSFSVIFRAARVPLCFTEAPENKDLSLPETNFAVETASSFGRSRGREFFIGAGLAISRRKNISQDGDER